MERNQGIPPTPEDKNILELDPYRKEYLIVWDIEEGDNPSYLAKKVHNPTNENIWQQIFDYYNTQCQEEILTGMTFEDKKVWLSVENQLNYQRNWEFAKEQETYVPVKVKLGTDKEPFYREFTTLADLQIFVSAVHYHIQNTIQKYWEIKDSIDWTKYEL